MIDLSLLQNLFGDEELVHKFLYNFNNEAPRQLEKLISHIQNEEFKKASIEAHSLKTQLAYLQDVDAVNMAYTLEKQTDSNHFDAHGQILELSFQLKEKINSITELIKNDYHICPK
ncbi:MAG: Hpt domain-containing protein [Saprospiraceae bacterium]|nr:Hpt domain-containing protein [Saprospiraceae bacterium]